MDKDLFATWFRNIFQRHCGEERPLLLFPYNQDSHFSYDLLNTAMENQASICQLLSL